jgi:hypothetical protein
MPSHPGFLPSTNTAGSLRPAIERYIAARSPALAWPEEYGERVRYILEHPCRIPELPGVLRDCLPLFMAPAIGPYVMIALTADTQISWYQVGLVPPFRTGRFITLYANLAEFFAERLKKASCLDVIRVYRQIVGELRALYPDLSSLFPDAPDISPEVAEDELWTIMRSI